MEGDSVDTRLVDGDLGTAVCVGDGAPVRGSRLVKDQLGAGSPRLCRCGVGTQNIQRLGGSGVSSGDDKIENRVLICAGIGYCRLRTGLTGGDIADSDGGGAALLTRGSGGAGFTGGSRISCGAGGSCRACRSGGSCQTCWACRSCGSRRTCRACRSASSRRACRASGSCGSRRACWASRSSNSRRACRSCRAVYLCTTLDFPLC